MRVTRHEAADLLGASMTGIGRLIDAGVLTVCKHPDGRTRTPSLSLVQVLTLRHQQALRAGLDARARLDATDAARARQIVPPDTGHDWVGLYEASRLACISHTAIYKRVAAGTIPYVEHHGRRWFRRDQMELLGHAITARRTRAPSTDAAKTAR